MAEIIVILDNIVCSHTAHTHQITDAQMFELVRSNAQSGGSKPLARSPDAQQAVAVPLGALVEHMVQMVHVLSTECMLVQQALAASYAQLLPQAKAPARDDLNVSGKRELEHVHSLAQLLPQAHRPRS